MTPQNLDYKMFTMKQ